MKPKSLLLAGLTLLLLLCAASSESLWIDEGDTAYYATRPTFAAWTSHLLGDHNADCQFPLSMLSTWGWAQLAGTSEYALRSLNVVFALAALGAFAFLGRRLENIRLLPLALLVQPFFWFYLNEARPYMLQIASGSLLLAGFLLLLNEKKGAAPWAVFLSGVFLLYHSTLLAFVPIGAVFLTLLLLVFKKRLALPPRWPWLLAGVALVLLPGSLYYLQTVLRGAGGARIWAVSPINFAWVYYEVAGAVGLGPAVWQLRDIAHDALAAGLSVKVLAPLALPLFFCALSACVFAAGFPALKKTMPARHREAVILGSILAFVLVVFAALSVVLHKAFWARHLAPVFPIYALLLYYCLCALWQDQHAGLPWRRVLVISYSLLLVLSCTLLALSPIHCKDDNRLAAKLALETLRNGGTVWWAASWHCGAYYGLPIVNGESTSPQFRLVYSPKIEDLPAAEKPALVLLSRPDVYDASGGIADYCKRGGYTRHATQPYVFTVWKQ